MGERNQIEKTEKEGQKKRKKKERNEWMAEYNKNQRKR
jgi:hypothetical protein